MTIDRDMAEKMRLVTEVRRLANELSADQLVQLVEFAQAMKPAPPKPAAVPSPVAPDVKVSAPPTEAATQLPAAATTPAQIASELAKRPKSVDETKPKKKP